jgi:hypothetical protein
MAIPVKVTDVPSQTGPGGLAEMDTDTGILGFMVMITGLEVAGLPEEQVMLDVRMQLMRSPFEGV